MKSRVTIDVDIDNQPIIKIEYKHSDDVRDKLVKTFLQTFQGNSCWATLYFLNNVSDVPSEANSTAVLRPVPPFKLPEESLTMKRAADDHTKMITNIYPKTED